TLSMTSTTFRERLIEARAKARLTQAQLADRAGVSTRQIARYEGSDQEPRLTTIYRLAEALEVPAAWLASGEEEVSVLPLPEIIKIEIDDELDGGTTLTFGFHFPAPEGMSQEQYLTQLANDPAAPLPYRKL